MLFPFFFIARNIKLSNCENDFNNILKKKNYIRNISKILIESINFRIKKKKT